MYGQARGCSGGHPRGRPPSIACCAATWTRLERRMAASSDLSAAAMQGAGRPTPGVAPVLPHEDDGRALGRSWLLVCVRGCRLAPRARVHAWRRVRARHPPAQWLPIWREQRPMRPAAACRRSEMPSAAPCYTPRQPRSRRSGGSVSRPHAARGSVCGAYAPVARMQRSRRPEQAGAGARCRAARRRRLRLASWRSSSRALAAAPASSAACRALTLSCGAAATAAGARLHVICAAGRACRSMR
jgi:hypothetical protein